MFYSEMNGNQNSRGLCVQIYFFISDLLFELKGVLSVHVIFKKSFIRIPIRTLYNVGKN